MSPPFAHSLCASLTLSLSLSPSLSPLQIKERRPQHGGHDIFWPVRETDLLALQAARPEMIASLNTGKRLLEEGMNTPEEFYPRQNLLDAVNAMRTLLQEAKARREGNTRRQRSALALDRVKRPSHRQLTRAEELELIEQLKVGEEKSRALEWTLQDMVEDLALLYNTITARVRPGSSDQELARFDRIHSSLSGLAENLAEKSRERAMMHPAKRDFLAKMLVLKGLLAAGNENFIYGERPPWGKPEYAKTWAQAEQEEEERQKQREREEQQQLASAHAASAASAAASPQSYPLASPSAAAGAMMQGGIDLADQPNFAIHIPQRKGAGGDGSDEDEEEDGEDEEE
jgi:hypothetical protein